MWGTGNAKTDAGKKKKLWNHSRTMLKKQNKTNKQTKNVES